MSRLLRSAAKVATSLAMVAAFVALPVGATPAAHAVTPTINCDTVAKPSTDWTKCQQLVGTAQCVWKNSKTSFTLAMGFVNPTDSILFASIPSSGGGTYNSFTANGGSAANPGHLDTFSLGTSTTAFTVTWSPTSDTDPVTWNLLGQTYNWYRTYTPCATKPVPVIGSTGGLAVGLLALLAIGLFDNRVAARVRRLLRSVPVVGGSRGPVSR